MAFKLTKKYFIGDALNHKWSSVYNYRPQSPEILAEKGEVFAVISLTSEVKEFSATTAGNLLVDCLHESYFESKKKLVSEALGSAIEAVQERLAQLLAHEEEVAEKGVDFDIAAVVLRGNEIYFASLGSHKIFILPFAESEELVDITAALRDPYGKGMVKIGSSYLQSDQRFLLASTAVAEAVDKDELLLSLASFNELRLRNREFEKPEEVALFMLGTDVQPSAAAEAELEAAQAKPIQDLLQADLSHSAADELQPEAYTDDAEELPAEVVESETISTEPEVVETEPVLEPAGPAAPTIKTQLQNLPLKVRHFMDNYKRRKQIQTLQQQRNQASQLGEGFPAYPSPATGINPQQTPAQNFRRQAGMRLRNLKDVLLYDFLQVNHGGKFVLNRNSHGFKILVVAGVIIGIIAIYGIISARGAAQARENQIRAANDQLTFISDELDSLQASPVLNSRSFADIGQREQLLTELAAVEQRFTADLDLLPQDAVQVERDRVASLRKLITRQQTPATNLLLDAGNFFEGTIIDIVAVGENIYALDGSNGKIYRQPVRGGTPELLVDGLVNPTSIVADSSGNLIIYDENPNSTIAIINPATKAINRVAGLSSSQLANVSQLAIYANTNAVYTIASDNSLVKILRRSGQSYSLPSTRFNATATASLKDIQILDGRILLLQEGIGFIRVEVPDTRLEAFAEVQEAIKQADFLGGDEDYIYFADAETKKVYVFTKYRQGTSISDFVAEIDLPELNGNIVEITADREQNLVFVATATRVYTFARDIF